MILLIDQNEQATNPKIVKSLRKIYPQASLTQLVVGDVNVTTPNGPLAIERKTSNDLLSSIADGRIFDQAERMLDRDRFAFASFIIHGSLLYNSDDKAVADGRHSKWNGASVRAALRTIQGAGCLVEIVKANEFVRTVQEVIRTVSKESHVHTKKPAITLETMDPRVAWLAGIPGIGPKRAKDWLDFVSKGKSDGRLCDALSVGTLFRDYPSESLPRGFGPKTSQSITDFLELDIEEYLETVQPF